MIAYTFWEIYYVEELEHTWGEQHKNRTNLKVITQHVHLDFLNNISANENTNLTHYSCSISWIGLDLMKTHIYTEVNVDSHGGCEKRNYGCWGEIRGEIPPLLKTKTPTSHRQLMLTVRGILGTHIGKFSLEKKTLYVGERILQHWWGSSSMNVVTDENSRRLLEAQKFRNTEERRNEKVRYCSVRRAWNNGQNHIFIAGEGSI